MLHDFFQSWWRARSTSKKSPPMDGRRPRRLDIEFLEDRVLPAVAGFNQAFVSTAYQALLGRNADTSGQNYWGGLLNGGATPTAVASGIIASTEFADDEVQTLYETYLRHPVDSSGLSYWVSQAQAGATWSQIEAGILSSNEYFQNAGNTVNGYVNQLFQDVLHRPITSSEISFFQQEVAGGASLYDVAYQVVTSPEADKIYILNDYSTILGENGNNQPAGVQYWMNQLESGADPIANMLPVFLGSADFTGQITNYLTQNNSSSGTGAGPAFIADTGKFGGNGDVLNVPASSSSGVPLVFVPNVGQTNAPAQYVSQGANGTAYFTKTGAVLSMAVGVGSSQGAAAGSNTTTTLDSSSPSGTLSPPPPTGEVSLGMTLLGGNANSTLVAGDQLASHSNYFIGNQSQWQTNVANYGEVAYNGVYSGINLAYRGVGPDLEYVFGVNPGASVSEIQLTFPGWQASVASNGSLVLYQPQANVTMYEAAPTIYQADGKQVFGGFVQLANGAIGFQVGAYDHTQGLIIDPTLAWSTFIGGSGDEEVGGSITGNTQAEMSIDASDNIYVESETSSSNFPVTTGAYETTDPNTQASIAVFKMNSTGTGLIYSTFLGSSAQSQGTALSIDGSGDAYVSGIDVGAPTTPYPTTTGAFDTTPPSSSGDNIVVTEVGPSGNSLIYSTYFAGGGISEAIGSAVDANGDLYIAGAVTGQVLPATSGAFQTNTTTAVKNDGSQAGFIAKIAAGGKTLDYATYITGSSTTFVQGITIDGNGDVFAGGHTTASDFPTTSGAYQSSFVSGREGWVAELNPSGSNLVYSTFLSGSGGATQVDEVVLTSSGDLYAYGITNEANFPTTAGAYQTTLPGQMNTFISELNSSGTSLVASTFLGSPGQDQGGASIVLDSSGNVYVEGVTNSSQFPNVNPLQTPFASSTNEDGFVAELDPTLSTLKFATNFGGEGNESVGDIQLDAAGNLYIFGSTTSTSGTGANGNFPVTPGAFQSQNAGGVDLFVGKIDLSTTVPPPPPGGGGGPPPGGTVIVSTSDIYAPNQTSDEAHDFGSLSTNTIFEYENLNITAGTDGQYEWYKWEASAPGTFSATMDVTSGGPLEMHLFEVQNGALTQLSQNNGGTLTTSLSQGQAIYVEVKGVETSPYVKSTGSYDLSVELD